MTWTPPPAPHPNLPGVHPGQILTRDHPAWHRRDDPAVWGTLAGAAHNPFHDALRAPAGDWGDGSNQRHWAAMAARDPQRHAAAARALRTGVAGLHLAMAVPSYALKRIAMEGRVRSAFDLDDFNGQHWSGNDGNYLPIRTDTEHAHFGYPEHRRADRTRPIYGYLSHDPHSEDAASGFGEHTLVLSKPALAHRTTFTGGDSLDSQHMMRAAPYTEPRLHALPGHFATRPTDPDAGVGDALKDPGHRGEDYVEAQYHGGISARDIHYAILRTPHPLEGPEALKANQHLGEHLSAASIPWVRLDARSGSGEPISWDAGGSRHQGVLMAVHAAVTAGALVADHDPQIHWQQGPDRYLIELTAPGSRGLAMGQIADLEWGRLYPPMPVASIITRGYWGPVEHPVDAEDVLARVRPAG